MTFSCLSKEEVRERYRKAQNKKAIIKVLAELTLSSPKEVKAFLGLPIAQNNHEARMALYLEGKNDHAIGDALDCAPHEIYSWRKKHGLPPNANPGNRKEK